MKERLITFDEIEEFLLKNKDIMDRVNKRRAVEESEDGSDEEPNHHHKSVKEKREKTAKARKDSDNSIFDDNMAQLISIKSPSSTTMYTQALKKNENSRDESSDLSPDRFDDSDKTGRTTDKYDDTKDRSSDEEDLSSRINEFLKSLISEIKIKEDTRCKLLLPPHKHDHDRDQDKSSGSQN